jgi:hypothetical protein
LLGTSIICIVLLLVALAIGVSFSILATSAEGAPITLDVPGGPSLPEIGLMVLRAAIGIIPYGLLAFALAVIGRSTALGIAGTLGYMLGEGIVVAILDSIGGIAADFREVAIGHHVASLIAANRIGSGDYNSIAARELPVSADLPDVWIAASWSVCILSPLRCRLLCLPTARPPLIRPLIAGSPAPLLTHHQSALTLIP